MKIIVPLNELSKKMQAISSVVPTKTTMPILSTVLMSAGGDEILFSATDLDISVTSRVRGTIEEQGRIAVPAKKIAEIVKSLSGGDVTLSCDGEKITIVCGKSRFSVNGRGPDDFPSIPKQEKKTSFTINPELFGKLVQKTTYAVSNDLTRTQLCGVLLEASGNGLSLVATDGHRLARVESKMDLEGITGAKVIVPPKAMSMVRAYSEGEEEITVSLAENSISFDMKESSIYSRLLEGPFPNYEKVIPTGNKSELVVSRSGLLEATKRVSILSDTLTHQVIFSIGTDKLTLNVTTQDIGEAHEELDCSYTGKAMDIGYNAVYVQDILRTVDEEEISFLLDRPDNAGIVTPVTQAEGIKHICIIMPLRIG